jgi:outer membrane immunogenic protein
MTNNGEFIMLRLRLALACGAILASAASAASAADLPGPPPAYPPPQAPAVYVPAAPPPPTWTGFYLGANAGYAFTSVSSPMIGGAIGAVPFAGPFSASGNAFLGGGQLGYNWQGFGPIVLGLETDFQGTIGSGSVSSVTDAINATAKNPWFGTTRGRLGYAFDRVMFYATGGAAYGYSTLSGTAGIGPAAFSSSTTYWTWTAGAGVEAAFYGPWSAKLEYLYAGSPSSVPSIPNVTAVSGRASTNLVRAGLNYHF